MNRRTFIATLLASTAAAGLAGAAAPRGPWTFDRVQVFRQAGTFHILVNAGTGGRIAVMTAPGEALDAAEFAQRGYQVEGAA